jgi:hypothetical protein
VDGSCDGVGDVVEFEVEEYVEAFGCEGGDDVGSFCDEEFEADLDPFAGWSEAIDEGEGGGGVGEVEGDDEAVLRGWGESFHT